MRWGSFEGGIVPGTVPQDGAAAGNGLRSEDSLFSSLAVPQLPVPPRVSP